MKESYPAHPANLTDAQVAQLAMRIALGPDRGEEKTNDGDNDAALLLKYLEACPWVSQDSPVLKAALRAVHQTEKARTAVAEATSPPPKRPLAETIRMSSSDGSPRTLTPTPSSPADIKFNRDGVSLKERVQLVHKRSQPSQPPSSPTVRGLGYVARGVILDLPLVLILGLYASCVLLSHVHQNYLRPQLNALVWDAERSEQENTYYSRHCIPEDLSTNDPMDLFLPEDATPQEARDHHLKHGFSIFPSALSRDTATNLRNFVISRNRNLTAAESIFVIENQNRYSFGLHTHEPAVAAAVSELSNHPILTPALEHIIGGSPALIELTAITASYGAVAQYWHDDVVSDASPVQFARSFGPSYSIFIQLQDTTAAMGATGSCPGTHFCTHGDMEDWCETDGFQLVTNRNNHNRTVEPVWSTGDALLMNMDSWHRGAAHTDPNAPDRVMMIITVVPKPIERAESRQMAQGITFSLRWDHWGMTWEDFQVGRFWLPFLRALSLFKSPGALWGLDYVSSSSMRIANEDNGFQRDDLDLFMERGGFPFLPNWLEGRDAIKTDDDSWYEYLTGTLDHCMDFLKNIYPFAVAGYFLICAILSSVRSGFVRGSGRAIGRLVLFHAALYAAFWALKNRVDNSGWAKDIQENRRYDNAFVAEMPLYPLSAPTVYPHRDDVLIATRYGSPQLHMYNDYVTAHPGNVKMAEIAAEEADLTALKLAGSNIRVAAVSQLVWPQINTRILHQSVNGTWRLYNDEDAMTQLAYELVVKDKVMDRSMQFLQSKYKYGVHRMTAMNRKWTLPHLRQYWEPLLLDKPQFVDEGLVKSIPAPEPTKSAPLFVNQSMASAPSIKTKAAWMRPASNMVADKVPPPAQEPFLCSWCKSGDVVEAFFQEDQGWYAGVLTHVTASGKYVTRFFDGTNESPYRGAYRPFRNYQINEMVQYFVEDEDRYEWARITDIQSKPTGTMFEINWNGYTMQDVHPGSLRRTK